MKNLIKKCVADKSIRRDFRTYDYIVQHEEWIGANCILYCTCDGKEYAEIVLERVMDFNNKELFCSNKIMFLETVSIGKGKLRQYTVAYQDTQEVTTILAESIKWYQSSDLICKTSRCAIAEWRRQNICLPSVMTALLILKSESSNKFFNCIREQAKEYVYAPTAGKSNAETDEMRICTWNREYYLLAVQDAMEAVKPLFGQKNLDILLIQKIEKNELMRFDP